LGLSAAGPCAQGVALPRDACRRAQPRVCAVARGGMQKAAAAVASALAAPAAAAASANMYVIWAILYAILLYAILLISKLATFYALHSNYENSEQSLQYPTVPLK
jgi:hypothetical protein